MKMRPLSCSFGLPLLSRRLLLNLFFALVMSMFLMQRRMVSKRYTWYCEFGQLL